MTMQALLNELAKMNPEEMGMVISTVAREKRKELNKKFNAMQRKLDAMEDDNLREEYEEEEMGTVCTELYQWEEIQSTGRQWHRGDI